MTYTATNGATIPARHTAIPANMRKRFYLVRHNDGGLQIVNLRQLMTDIAYTSRDITGPFRTFSLAVSALEQAAGVRNY